MKYAPSFIYYWRHLAVGRTPLREAQDEFASKVGRTRQHLSRIASGSAKASDRLVVRLIEIDPNIRQRWFL